MQGISCLVYSQCRAGRLTQSFELGILKKRKLKEWEKRLHSGVNWDPTNFFPHVYGAPHDSSCILPDSHQNCCSNLHSLPCPGLRLRNECFMINCHRTDGLTSVWLYSKSMPCTALVCILDARKFFSMWCVILVWMFITGTLWILEERLCLTIVGPMNYLSWWCCENTIRKKSHQVWNLKWNPISWN